MSGSSIEALDLAALLCSRICHDLISPVGAIVNGLEVLAEDKDEENQAFALELIKKSANTASAKLQFCRIAFGAAGSAGSQIDTGDAEKISRGFLEDEKTKIAWNLPRVLMGKNRVKLLLNMLLIAGQAIPRGGQITVDPIGEGERQGANGTVGQALPKDPSLPWTGLRVLTQRARPHAPVQSRGNRDLSIALGELRCTGLLGDEGLAV